MQLSAGSGVVEVISESCELDTIVPAEPMGRCGFDHQEFCNLLRRFAYEHVDVIVGRVGQVLVIAQDHKFDAVALPGLKNCGDQGSELVWRRGRTLSAEAVQEY